MSGAEELLQPEGPAVPQPDDAHSGSDTPSRAPSRWRRFSDRYLPPEERRDAWWLVLTVAVLTYLALSLGYLPSQVAQFFPEQEWLLRFADAWFYVPASGLVWMLGLVLVVKAAPGPRVVLLYSLLVTGIKCVLDFVEKAARFGIERTTVERAKEGAFAITLDRYDWYSWLSLAWPFLGVLIAVVIVGALDGAFTGSVERFRRVGFESTRRTSDWSWIGWTGRPARGGALLAGWFTVLWLAASLIGTVVDIAMSWFEVGKAGASGASGISAAEFAVLTSSEIITAAALVWIARAAVLRYEAPRSIWLQSGVGIPIALLTLVLLPLNIASLRSLADPMMGLGLTRYDWVWEYIRPMLLLATASAPLFGVWLALRREPRETTPDPSAMIPVTD